MANKTPPPIKNLFDVDEEPGEFGDLEIAMAR